MTFSSTKECVSSIGKPVIRMLHTIAITLNSRVSHDRHLILAEGVIDLRILRQYKFKAYR